MATSLSAGPQCHMSPCVPLLLSAVFCFKEILDESQLTSNKSKLSSWRKEDRVLEKRPSLVKQPGAELEGTVRSLASAGLCWHALAQVHGVRHREGATEVGPGSR